MTSAAARRGLGLAGLAVVVVLVFSGTLAERTNAAPAGAPPPHTPERRPLPAEPPLPDAQATPDDPDALALLRKAADAEYKVAYKGTQFVSTWRSGSTVESALLELTNLPGDGVIVRRAGSSATFVRRAHVSSAQVDVLSAVFSVRRTDDFATAKMSDSATSVGRESTLVDAVRADGELAARFYLDNATGLMLRREIYSPSGELVRESAYVDLRIDPELFIGHLPPLVGGGHGASKVVRTADYSGLAADGWDCCAATLAGRFQLDQVRESPGSLHRSYSDGLVTASIFEQHGGLKAGALDGFREHVGEQGTVYTKYGLMSYAVWSHNGIVYTVACETPECVDAIAAARSRDGAGSAEGNDGITQRLDRGMSRMGSWLNPFD